MKDLREIMQRGNISINHTLCEGKKVADRSSMGVEEKVRMVTLLTTPTQIIELLNADLAGIAFERPQYLPLFFVVLSFLFCVLFPPLSTKIRRMKQNMHTHRAQTFEAYFLPCSHPSRLL